MRYSFCASALLAMSARADWMKADNAICTADTTNADKILSMPYCEAPDCNLPCMYSGFVDSDSAGEHHIFYWLFKTEADTTAPLTIWLNGGPGSASEFGNFLENGPLEIFETIDSSTGSDVYTFTVKDNPLGSWADISNMIYVD